MFLALILSVSCAFSGSFAALAQVAEGQAAALDEGLRGYWDFEGEDPMENKGSDASLSGSLSGNAGERAAVIGGRDGKRPAF